MQAFGRDAIAGRISIAFDCCRMVYEIVSKCQGIRVLVRIFYNNDNNNSLLNYMVFILREQSKAPGGGTNLPISELIYKPLNVSVSIETFALPYDMLKCYF